MAEDDHTRRWQRIPPLPITRDGAGGDPLQALRGAISAVRAAPHDDEARRRLRALAAEQSAWDQLALLLADEARASASRPLVAAAFYEELADVHENLDQPLETIAAMETVVALVPHEVAHHDRLAWLYRRAGATVKAAQTFEQVAELARDDRARAALRAAGTLYREAGKPLLAAGVYRQIVAKKPGDLEAWRALDEVLTELQRWREVAEVRGVLAERATGVDKAVLLRSQARAFEQAGDPSTASHLVAAAAEHAPDDVSGVVDLASMLAREGRGREAADVLTSRIQESVADGAPSANIAALRLRLVDTLDEVGDHDGADTALDKLLTVAPDYEPARDRLVIRARRLRAAGDLRGAIQTYERAGELALDDGVIAELAEARTALGVQLAAADATAGDAKGAEQKLKKILARDRFNIDANLALADLFAVTDRRHAAIDHLRATLAAAPGDSAPEELARLVHRCAIVTRDLGDVDEAHQLLHEAHHLARRALPITLALGESCYARKLWREAAIHLGSLAEHPDAAAHASAVALGLVRAGQAEIRALKPGNAAKHYEAAVRIDPRCAAAWHQLAELATERHDIVRAAECFEHEAGATTDPVARVRLYEALGDLCLDVLGDPARAERSWVAVERDGSVPVLTKLLALQRRRGAGLERGETCERLAALSDAKAAKALTEEAADAFAAAGDTARARAVADYIIGKYPLDPDTVTTASTIAIAAGDHAAAATWLRRALGAWDAAGDRGDGEARRAELWRRLGDCERARALGQRDAEAGRASERARVQDLIARDGARSAPRTVREPDIDRAHERAALDAYQRAVVIAPESDAALAARRGLIELASSSGRRANTSRMELIEAEQDPGEILASARELATTPDRIGDARILFELARALGCGLLAEDEQFLDTHPIRLMASDEAYLTALDETERRALIDDADDAPLVEILTLLGDFLSLIAPDAKTALDRAALSDARRPPATTDAAALATYPQIAKALGGAPTLIYAAPTTASPDLAVLFAAPPVVVLGPRLVSMRARSRTDGELDLDADLRFRLGRIVELARPHRIFASGTDASTFERFVASLVRAFGPPVDASPDVAREAERIHNALPVALRRRLTERLAEIPRGALDATSYRAACERAADRAGLVACGHPGYAIHLAGGPDRARHLVELAASQRFLASQRKLRRR